MASVVQLRSRRERQQAEAVEEAQRLRSQLVETMERARVALERLWTNGGSNVSRDRSRIYNSRRSPINSGSGRSKPYSRLTIILF